MKTMSCLMACILLAAASCDAVAGNVTAQTSYTIQNSDHSRFDAKQKNEFNGGTRVYFESLAEPSAVFGWIEEKSGQSTFKKGWSRLILDWPVRISSIVIHKASVGGKPFKGGFIEVEAQTPKGKWVTLLEQRDRDIDRPLTLRKELKSVGPIKSLRINFRTPAPITIGPIDVNG